MSKILIVMAMPEERQDAFGDDAEVIYTGVGKVNAALTLARRLVEGRARGEEHPLVVNFGTAGSPRFPRGSVIACHSFLQHDMDATGLGFQPGETPFESTPRLLEFAPTFVDLLTGVCGSGDRFETTGALTCDVVDMEAYALAKVCLREGATFACVKYVTDGADGAAAGDWAANLPKAAAEFDRLYEELVSRR